MVKHGCGLTLRAPMFKLSNATKLNEFEFDARSVLNMLSKFQAFYTLDSFSGEAVALRLDIRPEVFLFCESDFVRG